MARARNPDFHVSRKGATPRHLVVSGALDMATTPRLREELADAAAAGAGDVVLDVSDLEFIDSTGLGALVAASRRLQQHGDKIVLRSPRDQLRQIIDVTNLSSVLHLEP